MKKKFDTLLPLQKLAIINFFVDTKHAFSFEFLPIAHAYFRNNYRKYYGTPQSSILVGANGNIRLTARVLSTDDEFETVKVVMLRYYSGDAELYDDSSYELLTTPNDPKGIEFIIPINILSNFILLR